MARSTSGLKAHRASLRKRAHNLRKLTAIDKLVRAVHRGTDSTTVLPTLHKTLDKAAKTGVLHHRKAARLKSRLAKRLQNPQPVAAVKRSTRAKKK